MMKQSHRVMFVLRAEPKKKCDLVKSERAQTTKWKEFDETMNFPTSGGDGGQQWINAIEQSLGY